MKNSQNFQHCPVAGSTIFALGQVTGLPGSNYAVGQVTSMPGSNYAVGQVTGLPGSNYAVGQVTGPPGWWMRRVRRGPGASYPASTRWRRSSSSSDHSVSSPALILQVISPSLPRAIPPFFIDFVMDIFCRPLQ